MVILSLKGPSQAITERGLGPKVRGRSRNFNDINKFLVKRNYIFGTDNYGRDVFGRVMLGARVSMSIRVIAVLISLLIGVFIGLVSGYYGGLTDRILMMVINIFWSIPTLLLVIANSLT